MNVLLCHRPCSRLQIVLNCDRSRRCCASFELLAHSAVREIFLVFVRHAEMMTGPRCISSDRTARLQRYTNQQPPWDDRGRSEPHQSGELSHTTPAPSCDALAFPPPTRCSKGPPHNSDCSGPEFSAKAPLLFRAVPSPAADYAAPPR